MPDQADQHQLDLLRKGVLFLTERNRELEARVARLEASLKFEPQPAPAAQVLHEVPPELPQPVAAAPVEFAEPPVPPVFQQPPPVPPPFQPPPLPPQGFESKVGLTILNRIGVFTLLIGGALFFKYAVDNDWLGPGARVAIGVIAALASLVSGDLLWKRGH